MPGAAARYPPLPAFLCVHEFFFPTIEARGDTAPAVLSIISRVASGTAQPSRLETRLARIETEAEFLNLDAATLEAIVATFRLCRAHVLF